MALSTMTTKASLSQQPEGRQSYKLSVRLGIAFSKLRKPQKERLSVIDGRKYFLNLHVIQAELALVRAADNFANAWLPRILELRSVTTVQPVHLLAPQIASQLSLEK